MKNLMCYLGFHKWMSWNGVRSCLHCKRKEVKAIHGYWTLHVEMERQHEDNL